MRRPRTGFTAALAIAAFVSSWFLPVNGVDYPGWRAFRIALSPLWPYGGFDAVGFVTTLVGIASALTNLWFLIALATLMRRETRFAQIVFPVLVAATILNASWLVGPATAWGIGYFLWVGSFIALSVAVRSRSNATISAQPAAV